MQTNSMDAIFNHVESAIRNLESGDPETAHRLLVLIRRLVAQETLIYGQCMPGSEAYERVIEVLDETDKPVY